MRKTMIAQIYSSIHSWRKEKLSYVREHRWLQLVLIAGIPLLVLGLFFILPLLSMVWLSLQSSISPGASLTLQNYVQIFQPAYAEILWRTSILTIQTTVIVTIIGYALAYSSVRFTKRTTLVLLLVILPYWTNYIIRMYAWITILQNGGVLSSVLNLLNFSSQPIGFLYTPQAVLLGFSYVWLPLATLPFYASLMRMNEDLIEAAKDLGSGPIKTFFTITLPSTIDGVVAGVALVAIPTFGAFLTPTLLGGSNVTMIGGAIETQFNEVFNWPLGAALGVVVSLFIVILLAIVVRLGIGGEILGTGGR